MTPSRTGAIPFRMLISMGVSSLLSSDAVVFVEVTSVTEIPGACSVEVDPEGGGPERVRPDEEPAVVEAAIVSE